MATEENFDGADDFGGDAGWDDDAGFGDGDDADGAGGGDDDWGDFEEEQDPIAGALDKGEEKSEPKEFSLKNYKFGDAAFGKVKPREMPQVNIRKLSGQEISNLFQASVKGIDQIRGQRGQLTAISMIQNIYSGGLFTLGGANSPVNVQVIPALQYLLSFCSQLPAQDSKRVSILTTIARAMEDCQQVQAREILRQFGDVTNQSQTFESQVQYFLLRQKEDALNSFITQFHEKCDLDHTQVQPWQQRAHLTSAYLNMLGDDFGLQGVEAAQGDRFLAQVRQELDKGVWAGVAQKAILLMLKKHLSLELFVKYLLADINNQSARADRLIDRDCIFKWIEQNMSVDEAHRVFYDEDRANDYVGQEPSKPTKENQFNPFLSTRLLVQILEKMGFVERA